MLNITKNIFFWRTVSDIELYVNNLYNRSDLLPRYDGSDNAGFYTKDRDDGSDTQIPRSYSLRMNGQASIPATERSIYRKRREIFDYLVWEVFFFKNSADLGKIFLTLCIVFVLLE